MPRLSAAMQPLEQPGPRRLLAGHQVVQQVGVAHRGMEQFSGPPGPRQKQRVTGLEPEILTLADSENPVCRETALYVLNELERTPTLKSCIDKLKEDPNKGVNRYAHFLADRAS